MTFTATFRRGESCVPARHFPLVTADGRGVRDETSGVYCEHRVPRPARLGSARLCSARLSPAASHSVVPPCFTSCFPPWTLVAQANQRHINGSRSSTNPMFFKSGLSVIPPPPTPSPNHHQPSSSLRLNPAAHSFNSPMSEIISWPADLSH